MIHDLQNPLSVIIETREDKEIHIDEANKIIKFELIDLQEILDNLKAYFKWKTLSDFKESFTNCELIKLVKKFTLSHDKVCINGNNKFTVVVELNFPTSFKIQKSNVSRIVNTITANSLRQIRNGEINLHIQLMSKDEIIANTNNNTKQ